jgi:tripartite-type tricarboxylate transporter receptor subunit TctC
MLHAGGSSRVMVACVMAVVCASAAAAARDAAYPNRPIRLIVPYPPGSGTDFTAREVGAQFSKALGQPVVIDNRPGGAATLGHNVGARSAPDGYTLLLGTTGGLVSGPALLGSKIPYDPLKDFTTIGLATYVPYSLVLAGSVPAKDVRELIDLAKASPGKLNFGSPGVGTPNHLGGAQLMTLTGIQMVHVPYKGGAPVVADLLGGQIQLAFQGLLQVLPHHRTGRLRVIGIGHPQRLKSAPDIPAIAETIPGFYNTGWWGIVAPAGTPRPIVDKLNAIMVKAIATPEMIQRFEVNGLEVASSTPEGYREIIRNDLQMWKKLIREAKISVDVLP